MLNVRMEDFENMKEIKEKKMQSKLNERKIINTPTKQ